MNKADTIRLPGQAKADPKSQPTEPKGFNSRARSASRRLIAYLRLRVHADAFRYDPVGYLEAVGWRMRGLRLRSRNRIAALAGRSSHAYDLWIARDEPGAMAARPRLAMREAPTLLVVIDCQAGNDGLAETVASLQLGDLRQSIVVVGGTSIEGVAHVPNPAEVSKFLDPSGTWICSLSPGDVLANGALEIYAAAAAHAGTSRLIYSDDDLIEAGVRSAPLLKPDWNSDLFQNHDFISGSAIVRVGVEDLSDLPETGWVRTLVQRAAEQAGEPIHLPVVLHHRRARPAPIVPANPNLPSFADLPSLTAIVPTRNHVQLLQTCIGGVKRAAYPSVELIVIDNGSDDPEAVRFLDELEADGTRVLRMPGPFNFSVLNNDAVKYASGEMLCFLNNDVEMLDPDWLTLLVRQAMRPDIGAVGARLLYPDGTVQHAGVCTGIGGGAGHAHRYQGADEAGYFERARLPQRVSAVTAACMVVAKEKFLAVEGFDELDFPVAFNDVDLCLKLNERGWQSFYEPRATLIHHESKSRGSDRAKGNRVRFAGELAALKRKWSTDVRRDPFHHPHLSPFCEQFLLAV